MTSIVKKYKPRNVCTNVHWKNVPYSLSVFAYCGKIFLIFVTCPMHQYFQGHTYCDNDFFEATRASRCSIADILSCTGSSMDFCLLHNPFRVYLLWCAHNHGHRCFEVYVFPCGCTSCFTLEFQPVLVQQHTKNSKALIDCQPRQELIKMIPVTAEQITRTTAKAKSSWASICKQANPMASTRTFQLLAKQLYSWASTLQSNLLSLTLEPYIGFLK